MLTHIGGSRLDVLYGLSVPVTFPAPHRPFAVVAVKMPALVTEVTDLGNVANLSRGEVAGPKLTAPNAGIAFAPITAHELLVPLSLKLAVGADVLPFTIDLAADPASIPLYLDCFSKALTAGEPGAAAVADRGELAIVAVNHGAPPLFSRDWWSGAGRYIAAA